MQRGASRIFECSVTLAAATAEMLSHGNYHRLCGAMMTVIGVLDRAKGVVVCLYICGGGPKSVHLAPVNVFARVFLELEFAALRICY